MNYHRFALVGGKKYIKQGVVPHLNLEPIHREKTVKFKVDINQLSPLMIVMFYLHIEVYKMIRMKLQAASSYNVI